MNNKIFMNLTKRRELGEIVSDTFSFLKANYKPLFLLFIKYVFPAFLLQLLSTAYYLYMSVHLGFSKVKYNKELFTNFLDTPLSQDFMLVLLLLFSSTFIYQVMFYATISYGMKSYINNNGTIVNKEVQENLSENWRKLFLLSFISFLAVSIGFLFCFLPSIYLFIPFIMAFFAFIFSENTVRGSITKGFSLVKGNWWMTFLIIFVLSLVLYAISAIFSLPLFIYSLVDAMSGLSDELVVEEEGMSLKIIISLIGSIPQNILYVIMIIGCALAYLNLDEKKNNSGILNDIETIGLEKDNQNN